MLCSAVDRRLVCLEHQASVDQVSSRPEAVGQRRPLSGKLALSLNSLGEMNSSPSTNVFSAQVRVIGWRVGAQTVSAIQAIREFSQLGLADAKGLVDRVLAGVPIVLEANNAESAQALVAALDRLKFDAQLVNY